MKFFKTIYIYFLKKSAYFLLGEKSNKLKDEDYFQEKINLTHPAKSILNFILWTILFLGAGIGLLSFSIYQIILLLEKSFSYYKLLFSLPIGFYFTLVGLFYFHKYLMEFRNLVYLFFDYETTNAQILNIVKKIEQGKNFKTISSNVKLSYQTINGEIIETISEITDGFFHNWLEQDILENKTYKVIYYPKNPNISRLVHKK